MEKGHLMIIKSWKKRRIIMKGLKVLFLVLFIFCLTACGKNYVGYWCNYQETATIVILLEDNITATQKANIEKSVNKYENLTSLNFISKEEYARQLGKDAKDLDIYANYFLTFDSLDSIGTYVEEIAKMPGVHEAKQGTAKSNIKIYNIEKKKKYLEAVEEARKKSLKSEKKRIVINNNKQRFYKRRK